MERASGKINLQALIKASVEEDWDFVDAHIVEIAHDQEALNWSIQEGLTDTDGNVRDLAVSILERSSIHLTSELIQQLRSMLHDENRYVGFRSAFTLFSHSDRSSDVIAKLNEALLDDDVREIAERYLSHK